MAFELDTSEAVRGLIRMADFAELARGPIRQAVRDTAELVEMSMRASISRRGPPRSTAGQPPASDTGALLRSIRVVQPRSRKRDERAYVFVTQNYGFMLESRTEKMAARPFAVPAAVSQAAAFVRLVEDAIERATGPSNR